MHVRRASSYADYEACVDLQRHTWGGGGADTVPAHLLSICQKVGGLVACAFDTDDSMLGFVFAIAGFEGDARVQWSHMLAVRDEARNQGVGRALKLFQREAALAEGIRTIRWTFDPLVARNAHLNLNRLGATVDRFERDLYGQPAGDSIYAVYGTDRFVVRWDLESERARRALAGPEPPPEEPPRPPDLEIPWDVAEAAVSQLPRVIEARDRLRQAIPTYLAQGREITGLVRDPTARRAWYRVE